MKSGYNLRRRIASLPPISLHIFETRIEPETKYADDEPFKELSEHIEHDVASPYRCLFCHLSFEQDSQGLEDNLEHMFSTHGTFMPDAAMVSDVETLLGYLSTVVCEWHECLYCGTIRNCTSAIQSHMRDKGHCKLDLDREPELLEFWETTEGVHTVTRKASSSAVVLSSGNTAVLKLSQQKRAKAARSGGDTVALRTDIASRNLRAAPREQVHRQLARRDEMGIQNIGPHQRQALVVALKRSQKEEAVASRASEWAYAHRANKQKHDQAHGPLSWAKGGMHNLLPR